MRVQDFRHFLPAICGLRPQTTFRRPRVRVFAPAAVLAPVAIPSFFPPEVLDLTHPFLFPVRSASRPGKTALRRRFPSSARKSPCRPQQQRFTVLAGRAGIAFFPAGQYPSLPTHSRISPALARFNSFPSFQSMSGYVSFNAAALFAMPLLPEVANGMTVLPFRS